MKSNFSTISDYDKIKYFTEITEDDRKKVKKWLEALKPAGTDREERFLNTLNRGILEINYDYMIATIEPSVSNGKIFYNEKENVGTGFSDNDWKQMAEEYSKDRGSRLAKVEELLIWYTLRIINENWTLDDILYDSSNEGNYLDSPGRTGNLEKTGIVKAGGYYDGQGNSYKITLNRDSFSHVGGTYYNFGGSYPIALTYFDGNPFVPKDGGTGVVVLTNYKK